MNNTLHTYTHTNNKTKVSGYATRIPLHELDVNVNQDKGISSPGMPINFVHQLMLTC